MSNPMSKDDLVDALRKPAPGTMAKLREEESLVIEEIAEATAWLAKVRGAIRLLEAKDEPLEGVNR